MIVLCLIILYILYIILLCVYSGQRKYYDPAIIHPASL